MSQRHNRAPMCSIVSFHQDGDGLFVAHLACGHNHHIMHNPPWQQREWITTQAGRAAHLGQTLHCLKCLDCAPLDAPPSAALDNPA